MGQKQALEQAQPILKNSLHYFSEVCSPIRGNAHNHFMLFKTPQIPQFPHLPQLVPDEPGPYRPQLAMIYPTPPPFSSHAYENNEVTSIMTGNASENKQLTSEPVGDRSLCTRNAEVFERRRSRSMSQRRVVGRSCDCPAPHSASRTEPDGKHEHLKT